MPVAKDDPRLERCGFAKLLGDGLEFYVKKYEVTMGRRSKSTQLDIVLGVLPLGDNMNISRRHASIRFNFEKGSFELVVLGKNGVTVRGVLHTPNSPPLELRSQDFVQMGDRSFYFLLPKDVSRLGPPAKQRRLGPEHHSPSAHHPPIRANGAANNPTRAMSNNLHNEPGSASPEAKQKSVLSNSSSAVSDLEYDDMSHSPEVDELVVSGTGMKSGEAVGDVCGGQDSPRKNADPVGSPPLVFTHPGSSMMHTVHLYRPGSSQPFG